MDGVTTLKLAEILDLPFRYSKNSDDINNIFSGFTVYDLKISSINPVDRSRQ